MLGIGTLHQVLCAVDFLHQRRLVHRHVTLHPSLSYARQTMSHVAVLRGVRGRGASLASLLYLRGWQSILPSSAGSPPDCSTDFIGGR